MAAGSDCGDNQDVSVAEKLQIRPGQRVAVRRLPPEVDLGVASTSEDVEAAEAAIVFVTTAADLSSPDAEVVLAAAHRGVLAWVAYPKAGQRGTDLNRDSLAALLSSRHLRPVRQVAIDDVWSALRFRPTP